MSDKLTLTDAQIYDIIKQYVEIKVDRMDTQELVEHVTENLTDWYSDFTLDELKDTISDNDEELYDELVDNVTNEITQPKVTITSQELEGDISTVRDSDYADKVDTLVSNMVASNDKEFTHDSEGC